MIRPAIQDTPKGEKVTGEGECRRWEWNREQKLEEELRTLQALIPDITKDIHTIFQEAVTDSLWNMLPENEARALSLLIGGNILGSPCDVYSALDSILLGGSQILKDAISEEFCANVHLLMEKVEREFAADSLLRAGWVFR